MFLEVIVHIINCLSYTRWLHYMFIEVAMLTTTVSEPICYVSEGKLTSRVFRGWSVGMLAKLIVR